MDNETLLKLQSTEIEILDEVVKICERHNITYFLFGGTLLGSVRHKGFIPWDDDIDIAMPRPDYEAFNRIAQKELPKHLFLQSFNTDKHYLQPFVKVRKNNTLFIETNEDKQTESHNGVFIDIMPLDYTKNSPRVYKKQRNISGRCSSIIRIKKEHRKVGFFKKLVASILPLRLIVWFQKKQITKFKRGDYLASFLGSYDIEKEVFPIDFFFPSKKLLFNGKEYCVPNKYDLVLSEMYGDYMQLPPVNERVSHNPVKIVL